MSRTRIVPIAPAGLPTLEVDAVVSLNLEETASVATHPVESALALTDEVNFNPEMLSLDVVFSDLSPVIVGVAGPGRAESLLDTLRAYYRAKARLEIIVPNDAPFYNMVLSAIRKTRDAATGRARPVSISLQRLRIAELDIVEAVLDADVQALGGLSSVDLGLLP